MHLSKESLEIFLKGDENKIQQHLNEHEYRGRYDIFIYTTKEGGPCVLCCNNNEVEPIFRPIFAEVTEDDPFQIGKWLLVWSYEFQDHEGDPQKNVKEDCYTFCMLEPKLDKIYYIGRYENTGPRNFQFAALWSSTVTVEDLGEYRSRKGAFAVRFSERLIDYSDVAQEKDKKEEITKNIEKMKKMYYRGVPQRGRFSNYFTLLTSVLGASVTPSDISGRGLVLLYVGVIVYSVFVAIAVKVFWFKQGGVKNPSLE